MSMDRGRRWPRIARQAMGRISTTFERSPQNWTSAAFPDEAVDRFRRSALAQPGAGGCDTHKLERSVHFSFRKCPLRTYGETDRAFSGALSAPKGCACDQFRPRSSFRIKRHTFCRPRPSCASRGRLRVGRRSYRRRSFTWLPPGAHARRGRRAAGSCAISGCAPAYHSCA